MPPPPPPLLLLLLLLQLQPLIRVVGGANDAIRRHRRPLLRSALLHHRPSSSIPSPPLPSRLPSHGSAVDTRRGDNPANDDKQSPQRRRKRATNGRQRRAHREVSSWTLSRRRGQIGRDPERASERAPLEFVRTVDSDQCRRCTVLPRSTAGWRGVGSSLRRRHRRLTSYLARRRQRKR